MEVLSLNVFFRKLESPQALKLLPPSSDDSNRKQFLGVSSSRILGVVVLFSPLPFRSLIHKNKGLKQFWEAYRKINQVPKFYIIAQLVFCVLASYYLST